jgi:hypothetical protein
MLLGTFRVGALHPPLLDSVVAVSGVCVSVSDMRHVFLCVCERVCLRVCTCSVDVSVSVRVCVHASVCVCLLKCICVVCVFASVCEHCGGCDATGLEGGQMFSCLQKPSTD